MLAPELTGRLNHEEVPLPVTSSGATLLIYMHTYYETGKQGFTASYKATVKEHTGKCIAL